jgi:hypothetical protein
MDTTQWYYGRDGARHGPVSGEELKRLAESGELRPHDLVWREGMTQWQAAQQATGFFPAAPAMPPPIPNQPPMATPYGAPPGYGPPMYGPPPGYVPPRPIGEDPGMRMLIPVGRSGWAIAAGYLGLFSVLGCFGPIAVIVSLIAIRDIKAHPDRHGMGRAVFGLVMGILGTILLILFFAGQLQGRRW